MKRFWVHLVVASVIISRLPFPWTGYGFDPDAWRVASIAKNFWQTGVYEVSRFPGYPLHEVLSAPLVSIGGSVLSNGATLVATLALLLAWWSFISRSGRDPLLLTICFAFSPLLWVNSATTMDYVWSLLFLVMSWREAAKENSAIAGIWIGLAIGFRPSNVVGIIPTLVLLRLHKKSARNLIACCIASLVTAAAAFLPLLTTYGISGWLEGMREQSDVFSISFGQRFLFISYRSIYSIGPLAALAAVALLFRHRHFFVAKVRSRDPIFVSSVIGVCVVLGMFMYAPLDRSYLLPALPLLMLVIHDLATKIQFILFTVCIVSFAFFNPDLTRHDSAQAKLAFNPRIGIVIEEYQKRMLNLEERRSAPRLALGKPAIVITGIGEQFWFENEFVAKDTGAFWKGFGATITHSVYHPDLHFVYLLNRAQIERARSAGYAPFCLARRQIYIESVLGSSLEEAHVAVIPE